MVFGVTPVWSWQAESLGVVSMLTYIPWPLPLLAV